MIVLAHGGAKYAGDGRRWTGDIVWFFAQRHEEQAVEILSQRRGKMYDPLVVDAFVRVHSTLCADAGAEQTSSVLLANQLDLHRCLRLLCRREHHPPHLTRIIPRRVLQARV